jgi:cysteine desulfurase
MERVYLDNNATTIVDPRVKDAMEPFFSQMYGNPNSLHTFGTETHPYMRIALDRLYAGIGARDEDDILLMSCATEANNTVLKGVYYDLIHTGRRKRIVTTQVEHPAIAHTCAWLETLGAEVTYLPVNQDGVVDVAILEAHLVPEETALVSIMWANNETGLIFPIPELAEHCLKRGVLFHTDAAQAIGKVPVDVRATGVDFLTFSGHKFHAPKGVGGLYARAGRRLPPLLHGGEQMGGKRAGTVAPGLLVGMGMAMDMAVAALPYERSEVRRLRDRLEDGILGIEGTSVIGRREMRTPNTILASFRGVEGEALIWDLNQAGIAASTGSACASEDLTPNPTFVAMGVSPELAHTGVRLSLSRFTTEEEVDYAVDRIRESTRRLRKISTDRPPGRVRGGA